MRAFIAFTKKEFLESLRTYRLIILLVVFLLLGVMSPLFAKLLPEILGSVDMGNGVVLTIPESGAMDSWTQFFKNVGQIGMLTLIITFCGIMANEFSRDTLINLLTKGMKRHTVILSKFLSASILWLASYLLCLGICYVYTVYYWPVNELHHVVVAFLAPWLFGELMIALLIFGGIVFKNFYGSLLTCGGVIIILNLIGIIPKSAKFNPVILSGGTPLSLLDSQIMIGEVIPAMGICVLMILSLMIASIVVFNKKQM